MTEALEPKDKLDAATTLVGVVSGPEDDALRWRQTDWRRVEDDVRRLRQRIFTASKAGDLKKVRNLQKLMLRSRANTLLSVRRVTERNAGRMTVLPRTARTLAAVLARPRNFCLRTNWIT
jgi:RNA-directed DNA polymerase